MSSIFEESDLKTKMHLQMDYIEGKTVAVLTFSKDVSDNYKQEMKKHYEDLLKLPVIIKEN